MHEGVTQLRNLFDRAKRAVFLGGAGVSTESGIPDFRGAHGLYAGANGRSYEEMLSLSFFESHPDAFWAFHKAVMLHPEAKPNPAHFALAELEKRGVLSRVLTQNIDGLHQQAGSQNVVELHGTVHQNACLKCGKQYDLAYVLAQEGTPHCACGGTLRPNIILYEEPLDADALGAAVMAVRDCDLLLVGGTSLRVYPAAGLIDYRKRGTPLVIINQEETPFDAQAQLIIRHSIANVLEEAIRGEGDQ